MHLVHPEHGAHMFDEFDVAVCPTCSTRWFRDQKGAARMERRAKVNPKDTWNEAIEAAAKVCDQGADAVRALKR